MGLTEEERRSLEAEFRSQVLSEHAARSETAGAPPAPVSSPVDRSAEIAALRDEVRATAWAELGYVQYTDSRGAKVWVTPEEYARRLRRRKSRRDVDEPHKRADRLKQVALFIGVIALAIAVGAALGGR